MAEAPLASCVLPDRRRRGGLRRDPGELAGHHAWHRPAEDPARFPDWAFRIVTHKAGDWLRQRKKTRQPSEGEK